MLPVKIEVHIGDLTKPMTALIERCANGLGVLYEPHRIEKRALADAKAKIIAVKSDAESRDIKIRAHYSQKVQYLIFQENIESIIRDALPNVKIDADPANLDSEWLLSFNEQARLAVSQEARHLWSRVLAEEANVPGSMTKRVLSILSVISKDEALLFQKLCGALWDGEEHPFITPNLAECWRLDYLALNDLAGTGLITLTSSEFFHDVPEDGIEIAFKGRRLKISRGVRKHSLAQFGSGNGTSCGTGVVLFTKEGRAISKIVDRTYPNEAYEMPIATWYERDCLVMYSPIIAS